MSLLLGDIMKENKDKELKELFNRQFKAQMVINIISTAAMLLFMLWFYNNLTVVIFIGVAIISFWAYSGVKLYFLKKAIKKMSKEEDLTTLSKTEKKESIEAVIDENEENWRFICLL